MAGVFLSYDRTDLPRARSLAMALEKAGHSVWWDSQIKGGAQYSKEIERALKQADVVVVLWSSHSVDSAWVRDEAAAGRDSGRLVPARLDQSDPPLGFRQYHTIDLSRWKGGRRGSGLAEMLAAIAALSGGSTSAADPEGPSGRQPEKSRLVFALLALGLVAIAAALLFWAPWRLGPAASVVVVRAADSAPDSIALARELLVDLGAVQASRPSPVQLVEDGAAQKPDLILEVSGNRSPSRPSANLTLLRGKDRQLFASNAFEAGSGRQSELKPALAMSAARLVGCAAEAMAPGGLMPERQKLYIDACGRFGMLYGTDNVTILLPMFQQILEREHDFVPAWKQLLLAGASLITARSDVAIPTTDWLRTQLAGARRADADMPEIGLAELALAPTTAFADRLRMIDGINARIPDNPYVLDVRAQQLMLVGRMNEAVMDAEKAATLDPLSPFTRGAHIRALAHSGRLPRAFQELEQAAPLALGAKALIEPRFRLNMRYGDPRVALDLLRAHGTSKQHEAFLLARIEPTPANIDRALAVSRATAAELGFYASHLEVLLAFGREEEAYRTLMGIRASEIDETLISTLFRPSLAALRQDPSFLRIVNRFGLVDYWRTSGKWPDFCSEPGLPYDCKAEAAKLATKAPD